MVMVIFHDWPVKPILTTVGQRSDIDPLDLVVIDPVKVHCIISRIGVAGSPGFVGGYSAKNFDYADRGLLGVVA
jgi:hypothetical protein